MTNTSTLLADFFADADIDSLRVRGLDLLGVDIAGVYCLHTGRKVGTFDDDVIQFAIDEESADDDDALIEALVSRVVASMRPSPMLNRPDRITLLNMAEKFPVDVFAYLVNRLHSNRYLATHRNLEVLQPYVARIHLYSLAVQLAASGVDFKPWIHWLLELDAKRNLHDLTPPSVEKDRLGKWIETKLGESLFRQIGIDNHLELLKFFEAWTFERVKEFDRRDSEALAQDKWFRGNTMTQPAYARSWLENPQFASKRAELAHKAKGKDSKTKLARPKSERTSKLDSRVNQFLHLLDNIIDSPVETAATQKSGPVLRTGANLFRKKESI